MDVGLQMIFATYGWSDVSDEQAWDEELRLARLAADLGFDVLWSVEHHFNDYSFCPDNLQLMSYLAAECPNVGLGTAADKSNAHHEAEPVGSPTLWSGGGACL